MIQRERELEGDEFKDKEAFVTQAYKDQMAELRMAEEEEKRREGTFIMEFTGRYSNAALQKRRGRRTKAWVPGWPTSTRSY